MDNTFVPCRKCHNQPTPGYIEKEVNGYRFLEKCDCRKRHDQRIWKEIRIKRIGLRPSVGDYDPRSSYKGEKSKTSMEKLVKYVEHPTIRERLPFLYLYGPYGTQKTTLAQWAALTLGATSNVKYTLMRTLVKALTDDAYTSSTEDPTDVSQRKEYLQQCVSADYLFIDESFDLDKMTIYKSNYQLPFIDEFLRDRMDLRERPTIFISNVPIAGIDSKFSALKDLLSRTIERKGGALQFLDNYAQIDTDFNIEDIFASV